jgi:alpha-beta hydrolase superfamily lysophospholipase
VIRPAIAALLVASIGACVHAPPPYAPMRAITYSSDAGYDTVVVLLPGLRDRANEYERRGLVRMFMDRRLPADLVAADAHVGYYERGTAVHRLHEDVIGPLLRRYRHIVLIGVSMGAYGAVRYTMAHPRGIDALVLFSPFLGAGPFMRGLAEAGDEDFAQTWAWLEGDARPRVLLGYGAEDAFFVTDRRLAAHLPLQDVFTTSGGHFWRTWRKIFAQMLDRRLIVPPH